MSAIFKNILLVLTSCLVLTATISLIYFSLKIARSFGPVSQIEANAKKSSEIAPDEVLVSFLVEKQGLTTNLDKMNAEIDEKTTQILAFLDAQKVPKDKIKTDKQSYTVFDGIDRFSASSQSKKEEEKKIYINFQLTLSDIDKNPNQLNQIWAELLKLGVTNLTQNSFQISDSKLKTACLGLQNEALKMAMEDAIAQLKVLGLDEKNIQSTSISKSGNCQDNNNNYRTFAAPTEAKTMSADMNSSAPAVMPGVQKVEASVSISVQYTR